MKNVYQGSFVRLVSGDQAPDDISKPDPKGFQVCTIRVTTDETGKVLEFRAGQLGPIEGVQNPQD